MPSHRLESPPVPAAGAINFGSDPCCGVVPQRAGRAVERAPHTCGQVPVAGSLSLVEQAVAPDWLW